jgi:hypothetical protein
MYPIHAHFCLLSAESAWLPKGFSLLLASQGNATNIFLLADMSFEKKVQYRFQMSQQPVVETPSLESAK